MRQQKPWTPPTIPQQQHHIYSNPQLNDPQPQYPQPPVNQQFQPQYPQHQYSQQTPNTQYSQQTPNTQYPQPANDYSNPKFIQDFQSSAAGQLGMQLGSQAYQQVKENVNQNLNKYVSVNNIRYYFNVSNSYVFNKLQLILFPFRHVSWSRLSIRTPETGIEQFRTPREDLNAPDLYIPVMSYVTYILLVGISLGTGLKTKFTPDVLGITASTAFFLVLFEVLLIKGGGYFLNVNSDMKFADLISYCGYKFVPLNFILVLKFWSSKTIVYSVFLYLMIAYGFFTLRSLRHMWLPESDNSAEIIGKPARRLLATVLERLEKLCINKRLKRDRKYQILRNITKEFTQRDDFIEQLENILPLLLPSADIGRRYGHQEKKLGLALINVFGFHKDSPSYFRIINWNTEYLRGQGNLARIMYDILLNVQSSTNATPITLENTNELLDDLASHNAFSTIELGSRNSKSRSSPTEIFRALFCHRTPLESKWLIKIILKNTYPISFTIESLLSAIHPCANSIYKMHCSLRYTSQTIQKMNSSGYTIQSFYIDNEKINLSRFKEAVVRFVKPTIGVYISCMQCERPQSVAQVLNSLSEQNQKSLFAEIKYDGERMQIHVSRNSENDTAVQIHIFSKSGRNSTQDRYRTHNLINEALGLKTSQDRVKYDYNSEGQYSGLIEIEDCILEGELLVYDELDQKIETFGGISDFREISWQNNSRENRHLMIVFFDVLYINGLNIMQEPFFKRRKLLQALVKVEKTYAELSHIKEFIVPNIVSSLQHCNSLSEYFANCVSDAQEGLIIKGRDSVYSPGKRENWYKLKLGYMGLGESSEYVILGGSFDSRENFLNLDPINNPNLLNVFHIGCLINKEDVLKHDVRGEFRILFSVSLGFSIYSLKQICSIVETSRVGAISKCNGAFASYDGSNLEYDIDSLNVKMKIDFLFKSPIAVEIVGQEFEFNHTSSYYIPRHPVFQRLCGGDKTWKDSISFQELQEIAKVRKASFQPQKRFTNVNDHIKHINLEYLKKKWPKVNFDSEDITKNDDIQLPGYLEFKNDSIRSEACSKSYRYEYSLSTVTYADSIVNESIEISQKNYKIENMDVEIWLSQVIPACPTNANIDPVSSKENLDSQGSAPQLTPQDAPYHGDKNIDFLEITPSPSNTLKNNSNYSYSFPNNPKELLLDVNVPFSLKFNGISLPNFTRLEDFACLWIHTHRDYFECSEDSNLLVNALKKTRLVDRLIFCIFAIVKHGSLKFPNIILADRNSKTVMKTIKNLIETNCIHAPVIVMDYRLLIFLSMEKRIASGKDFIMFKNF